jgi:hypothetical protein
MMEQDGMSGEGYLFAGNATVWQGRLYKAGSTTEYPNPKGFVRSWDEIGGWKAEIQDLPAELYAIEGFIDGLAVAGNGLFYTFDGTTWTQDIAAPVVKMYDVCGSSVNDCFACGVDGNIYHRTATGWETAYSCPGSQWYCIQKVGDCVYFAGKGGQIGMYKDGVGIQLVSPTTDDLWHASYLFGQVYFCGYTENVRVADGACTLEVMPAGSGYNYPYLFSLDGDSYAAGGDSSCTFYLWVKDGQNWRKVFRLPIWYYTTIQFESEGRQMLIDMCSRMLSLIR